MKKGDKVYSWNSQELCINHIISDEPIVGEIVRTGDLSNTYVVKSVYSGVEYVCDSRDLFHVGTGPIMKIKRLITEELEDRLYSYRDIEDNEMVDAYSVVLGDLTD